jgi:hypothetical protein
MANRGKYAHYKSVDIYRLARFGIDGFFFWLFERTMPATAPAAVTPFAVVMLREYPIPVFQVVVQVFNQRAGRWFNTFFGGHNVREFGYSAS